MAYWYACMCETAYSHIVHHECIRTTCVFWDTFSSNYSSLSESARGCVCLYEGRLLAHCTLRLLNPECHLSSDWSAEPLHLQSSRAVSLLYADSISSSSSQQPPQLMLAPALAYCFPLLRAVVTSRKNSEQDEALVVKCLDFLSTHATKLRSEDPNDEVTSVVFRS